MSKEYHYLIAGLPDLLFETTKLNLSVSALKSFVKEQLSIEDYQIIESYFWRYDNQNLLSKLLNTPEKFNEKGNLSQLDWDTVLELIKKDELKSFERNIPSYFKVFIEAFREDKPIFADQSWENQLTRLYFEYLLSLHNDFLQKWYGFEIDLQNILTASISKKYKVNVETELIGEREINDILIKSNAKDFGLGNDFPKIDEVLKLIEESNLLEREKKIDFLKWSILEDWAFFYYFTVERVFVYLLEIDIIDRWISLDKKTGEELFNRMLKNLETQNKFPENM